MSKKTKSKSSGQIFTLELSKDKLIEILTPILKKNKVIKDQVIYDFMISLDTNQRFHSMTVVMLPK
jgi:hypothetical protein